MNIEEIKSSIIEEIEKIRKELWELSLAIHDNPELGFQEIKAVEVLTRFLSKNGFSIENNFAELPTAFRATYGKGKPAIAFLAEYDALPQLGHACGHNLIAAASTGAGVAAKLAVERFGGTVMVIGTPSEELHGGKMYMVKKGVFIDVDVAMMMHPGNTDLAVSSALACQGLDIEFFGKSAHAAAEPELGINALEAMIQSYNAINSLRQHIKSSARIHGIITEGGTAANVVPDRCTGTFIVRATEMKYLTELKEKVLNCFQGAAKATGARLEYKYHDYYYAPVENNYTLSKLFVSNMEKVGRNVSLKVPEKGFGSTDFGNVSQVIPGMHAWLAITEPGVAVHSPQFAQAAASDRGQQTMLDAARGLAMVLADLLADPEHLVKIKSEFNRQKHDCKRPNCEDVE